MNSVQVTGRLVKDAELYTSSSGKTVCSFTLAVDGRMKNADGTKTTCFIGCVCFGNTAESTARFTRKGSLVGIEGALNQRKYQRHDGSTASVIEIIADRVQFLEPKKTHDDIPPFDDVPANTGTQNIEMFDLPQDDLPF